MKEFEDELEKAKKNNASKEEQKKLYNKLHQQKRRVKKAQEKMWTQKEDTTFAERYNTLVQILSEELS